jgi:SAM-dependent methyltransferase
MVEKPFQYKNYKHKHFVVPEWFKKQWQPDEQSIKYWEWQYQLAKEGHEYKIPDDKLRMPNNRLHQEMSKLYANEILEKYGDNFKTILDIGCNDGYMVDYFNKRGKAAIGIDESVNPVDRIYHKQNDITVLEMDMHDLNFKDESYDAVWCRHTLEHSFSPLQVLAEITRVLKPGGFLFCILPPPPSPSQYYPGHYHQIPDYQLSYLLELSGFEVLEIKTSYYSFEKENDNLEIRSVSKKTVKHTNSPLHNLLSGIMDKIQ